MITLFRKYAPANIFYLIPVAFLLCIGAFVHVPSDLQTALFAPAMINLTGNLLDTVFQPRANVFITVMLTILQGILLNRIVNQYNLLGKPSFLPALMYVTLASMLTPFLTLTPTLICNFLLIWMIDKFLSIYRRTEIVGLVFDLGLIIAIGTLFYFPFILFLLLVWMALLIFRPFNWREWIAGPLGFITIYLLIFIIYVWTEQLDHFYKIWLPLTQRFPTSLSLDVYDYWVLLAPLIILLLFIISLRQNIFKSIVHIRKSFQLLFLMFLIAAGSFYLNSNLEEFHFLLCLPPISIYAAYYFSYANKKWFYESLFILFIFAILFFQWY